MGNNCWSKDENGNDVFDEEEFWRGIDELIAFAEKTACRYIVAIEGKKEGLKTIRKIRLN